MNQLYDFAVQAFMSAQINLIDDTIKITLVDTAYYTFDSSHRFLSDIPLASRISTVELENKTLFGRKFNADDVIFPPLSNPSIEAFVLWKDTGDITTSPLILYIDTATNLPFIPSGGHIRVRWDNSLNEIFNL